MAVLLLETRKIPRNTIKKAWIRVWRYIHKEDQHTIGNVTNPEGEEDTTDIIVEFEVASKIIAAETNEERTALGKAGMPVEWVKNPRFQEFCEKG